MSTDEVKQVYLNEFGKIKDKFEIIEETIVNLLKSKKDYIFHPGVYVFWEQHIGVIKVGRHLENSRKRAMQHIKDNTHNEIIQMKDLLELPTVKVILFNLKMPNDYHWAAALEIFLENNLNPIIKAKRNG